MKKIFFVPLVLITVVVIDLSYRWLAQTAFNNIPKNMYSDFSYETYKGNDEIIILGASRAQHHYNCRTIEDSLGFTCFNLGVDGYGIAQQYACFNQVVNNESLKYVVIDLSPYQLEHEFGGRGDDASIFVPYYWSNKCVKKLLDDSNGKGHNMRFFSSLVQFNNKEFTILKILSKRNVKYDNPLNGYLPIDYTGVMNTDHGCATYKAYAPNTDCVQLLDSMVKKSKGNDIRLLIAVSPVDENWRGFVDWLSEYAKSNEVPFLDCSEYTDIVGDQKLFKDRHHLNEKGAQLYTNMVVSKLKSL